MTFIQLPKFIDKVLVKVSSAAPPKDYAVVVFKFFQNSWYAVITIKSL